jgi:7-cyano-7-deazaguanine reductase
MNYTDIKEIEGKVLGKQVDYPQQYDPTILVAVPRKPNRDIYNIESPSNLFKGYDTSHAYELSFITEKGLPVSAMLKIVYDCNTPNIVESKSLKLYLNSFNMTRFGFSAQSGLDIVLGIVEEDLSALIGNRVKVFAFKEQEPEHLIDRSTEYTVLEECSFSENISFDSFDEDPDLLKISTTSNITEQAFTSHILRSNCKITNQPDWGSVFIRISGKNNIDAESLLKYLVSFRNENHFHEEVCEMIFKRIYDNYKPEDLAVTCIFTRRGGIDICPSRTTRIDWLFNNLVSEGILTEKLIRQ